MHHIKPKIQKQNGKQRNGKGFSSGELKKAGLDKKKARKIGLPVDLRRATAHDENVEVIKAYVEKKRAETKPKPEPKPQSTPQPKKKPKSQKPP